jgi:hypothetical protein
MRCQFEQANYNFFNIYIEEKPLNMFFLVQKSKVFFSKYDILGLYPLVEHRGNET